ncbi:MAG: fumarylacetoacetase [Phycisphaerales bacterium]|nr:fumarylacetoacetase [Phycisphaerales bacterium]
MTTSTAPSASAPLWARTDDTHDPALRSWVTSANDPGTDFPIQNLPLGVFARTSGEREGEPCVGMAIGGQIVDLGVLANAGAFDDIEEFVFEACCEPSLNELMWEGAAARRALRKRMSQLLREGDQEFTSDAALRAEALVAQSDVEMLAPADIGDYTDFYASIHHATNVGSMFRPDSPLLPNYKHIPIGYHGRASSIVISGTPVQRPCGQTKADDADMPSFGPCRLLDYEMEVGAFIGEPNSMGHPVSLAEAEEHLFGLVLVNDWSARDMQKWEYVPLGPFLAKNFATTISPWIVTMEALAPFRVPAFERDASDPKPLPYLADAGNAAHGGIGLTVEVWLQSKQMKDQDIDPIRLSRGPFSQMYWTIAQMLAHHTSGGCNMMPGDLIASGTISGPTKDSRGSMLELSWRGTEPIELPSGETRKFLADGDEVIMRGFCERAGYRRIGFGECRGVVMPAQG